MIELATAIQIVGVSLGVGATEQNPPNFRNWGTRQLGRPGQKGRNREASVGW